MTNDRQMITLSARRQPALRELNWRIVEIAQADGRRSLWVSLARKLFGISVARPLANDRLEALRRFSVCAWHWNLVRPSELGALIDAGYSRADALQILAHIAAYRGRMPCAQDDLLKIGSGLEESLPSSRRPSSPVPALPAPQVPSLAPRRGQSLRHEGWQPCLSR